MNERHRKKRLDAVRYVLAMPKSIWYNFRLLPLRQACKLPLLVSHRTKMVNLSGKLDLQATELKVGLVKIGFNTYQGTDFRYDRPIHLGDNVWIGCHTILTKGTTLASNTTVGAGSVVHGVHEESCVVLAGNPATIVKSGVKRR